MVNRVKISPSILGIELNEVPNKLRRIEDIIDYVHIDVMDGKFVTNSTNGLEMFNMAKMSINKPLDVHLMVANPMEESLKYIGANIITFHIEALKGEEEVCAVINRIKSLSAKVGVSLKPDTSIETLIKYLDKIDLILVMTVEPGYGGQKLIPETLLKIKELRNLGFSKIIEVDGGVTIENAMEIKKTTVDIIVAGTAIFGAENPKVAIEKIIY